MILLRRVCICVYLLTQTVPCLSTFVSPVLYSSFSMVQTSISQYVPSRGPPNTTCKFSVYLHTLHISSKYPTYLYLDPSKSTTKQHVLSGTLSTLMNASTNTTSVN